MGDLGTAGVAHACKACRFGFVPARQTGTKCMPFSTSVCVCVCMHAYTFAFAVCVCVHISVVDLNCQLCVYIFTCAVCVW